MHDYLPTEITAADRIAARQRGRRRRGLRRAGVATAAIGLSLGSIGAAGIAGATVPAGTSPPSQGAGQMPAAAGTVASVGTSSFTLTTKSNTTVTVDVSSSTTYRAKSSGASLADVTVGAHVAVVGSTSGSTVQANYVLIGLTSCGPWGGGANGAAGGPGGGMMGSPPAA